MTRLTRFALILTAAFLLTGPLLAQGDPGPTPAPITLAVILAYVRAHPLQAGAFLSGLIYGLRNVPFFADIFVRWPKFGIVVNAVTSLLVQVGACLQAGMTSELPMCVLNAAGMFLSAAGLHMVVKTIATGRSDSGAAKTVLTPNGAVVEKATGQTVDPPKASRATLKPLG